MTLNRARLGRLGGLSGRAGVFVTGALALPMAAGVSAADGDLRLVEAARSNDPASVRRLLKQGADPNVRAHDGSTALLWAAHWNDLETADLLIRAGARRRCGQRPSYDAVVACVHECECVHGGTPAERRRKSEYSDSDR